jgi:hypothetical protein
MGLKRFTSGKRPGTGALPLFFSTCSVSAQTQTNNISNLLKLFFSRSRRITILGKIGKLLKGSKLFGFA